MSKFGEDLVTSLGQAVELARGKKVPGMRVTVVTFPTFGPSGRRSICPSSGFRCLSGFRSQRSRTGSKAGGTRMHRQLPIFSPSNTAPKR